MREIPTGLSANIPYNNDKLNQLINVRVVRGQPGAIPTISLVFIATSFY